jgi:hypothetical protein
MLSSLAPLAFLEPGTSIHFPGLTLFMETEYPSGEMNYWISLKIPGTTGGTEIPEDVKFRLFCISILQQLPNEGLLEAAESLLRMWEFYRVPFVSTPALPPLSAQIVELGQTYVRPTFYVTEED